MTCFHAMYTTSKKPVHVLRKLVSRAEISPDINWHCRHAVERAIKPVHTLLVQSTGTCCRWLYYDDPDIPTVRPSDVYRSRRPCGLRPRWHRQKKHICDFALDGGCWQSELKTQRTTLCAGRGRHRRNRRVTSAVIVHLDTTSCWCCCYSSLEPIQCDINANQDRTPLLSQIHPVVNLCALFLTWWCYMLSAVYAVARCLSVCQPVCYALVLCQNGW